MGYTSGYTAVTGANFTSAQYNQYVRDNLQACWGMGAMAGAILYLDASHNNYTLAAGFAGQFLKSNTGYPIWVFPDKPISGLQRQGGSASAWDTPGSSNYTPSQMLVQAGIVDVTDVNGHYGYTDVTFPVAFSNYPIVFSMVSGKTGNANNDKLSRASVQSNSVVRISLNTTVAPAYQTMSIHWLAIGQP